MPNDPLQDAATKAHDKALVVLTTWRDPRALPLTVGALDLAKATIKLVELVRGDGAVTDPRTFAPEIEKARRSGREYEVYPIADIGDGYTHVVIRRLEFNKWQLVKIKIPGSQDATGPLG